MSTFSSFSRQAGQLSDVLQGEVVLPGQHGFEEARRAFNLAADQQPAAVVFAESAQDVVAAVTLAADHGRRVAPQGTGHNAMPLESLANSILLKTERMRGIQIDPAARTARIGAGARWGDVMQAAARHGLAGLPGLRCGPMTPTTDCGRSRPASIRMT
jgi:FAD/FMN-containing dehydrogenase